MGDVSVAHALDEHFGFDGAIDLLFTTAGLHADTLQNLLGEATTIRTGTAP